MPKSTRNISKETITTLSDAPTPPPGKILQIRSGKVKTLVAEPSGIFKQVQPGRVFVNEHGIGNDEHVYPIHWSPDRALHQYASEHYASWRCEDACPKPELFDYGAFGENIVGTNMNEENVCVGDVYRIGKDVVVEVSEPRSPCYKLNLRFEWGRALKRVSRTARTGWNMRVKTAGYICAGDVIQLVERPHPRWSILNIKRVIQGKNVALHLVAELCNLEVVTSMVRDFAQNRLQSTPKRYEVVDIRPVTSRIKQFTFQLQETFTINEPAFREFTFAQIEFGTGDEKYSRSYSIVSGDLNRFSLGVAHDDHSRGGSRYLHTKLKVGDMITMAPGGVPKAVEDEQKCIKDGLVGRRLVIIGGIGVTAFLPKISEWEKKDIDYEVHYATRSRDEAAFLDRFPDEKITLYAKIEGKRLDLNTLIPGPDKDGKHTTRIYCCGPEGLMNAAQRRAEDLGYPDYMLHFESFGADSAGTKGEPFTVEVNELESRRREKLDVPSDKTLLTVLREAGFDMTFFCEMGGCGACKVTVCDGKVDHRGTALYPKEKKTNMLSCTLFWIHVVSVVVWVN
uniref:Vanillate o-demethylase n=1 Tax=Colletotrichum fructicola (strain Nara gc5) TaxID=1213859 RepID=L2FE08_COLFN